MIKASQFPIEVDPQRAKQWVQTAAARLLKPSMAKQLISPKRKPQFGDLVLCQVEHVGQINFIETAAGFDYPICPKSTFVGTISTRYALDVHVGVVPQKITSKAHILNNGGTIGEVISSNNFVREPTEVKILAFIGDASGNVINTISLGQANLTKRGNLGSTKLILAVGAGMDYGKTTSAAGACYCLSRTGRKVVAGKATGTSRSKDIHLVESHGAIRADDFTRFGYPATYMINPEEMLSLFWALVSYLCGNDGPDYVVIELADGIRQQETNYLISHPEIISATHGVIYACGDADAAFSGVSLLRGLGYSRVIVSGKVSNSEAGKQEVRSMLGDKIPIFDALDRRDPRDYAKLFK